MVFRLQKYMANSYELTRYQRQIILPGFGVVGQERLRDTKVLIVGVGGLGSPVALYLAAMGVGTLGLCDGDLVSESNLQRQVLFTEGGVGKAKGTEAARKLRELNSGIEIKVFLEPLDVGNVRDIMAGFDVIVDGTDNFSTRYLINDAAVELGKVFVGGAIQGMTGQVSVFNALLPGGKRGPTLRCLFPEPPPIEFAPPCAELGVLGVVPGVVGLLQATEVVKIVSGVGEALIGELLLINLATSEFKKVRFGRSEAVVAQTRIQDGEYYRGMCMKQAGGEVREMTSTELQKKIEAGEEVVLVDVREDFERAEDSLGGIHIPMGQILERLDEVPRDEEVVVYCRSGGRSYDVVAELQSKHGFNNLLNLAGGILGMR